MGEMAKQDPDYAIRDLYNSISNGNFPTWTMYIQVMTFEEAENWEFNPFDLTKVWPHADSPLSLLASSPLTGTQETILPRWSKLRSVLLILCLESSRVPTKRCRVDFSPTTTPIDTVWEPTGTRFLSTALTGRVPATTRETGQ